MHLTQADRLLWLGHGKVSTDGPAVSRLVVDDAACQDYLARMRMRPISQTATLKTKVALTANAVRRREHFHGEPTTGDQPGVRVTKAAAVRSVEPGSASKPTAAEKAVLGKTTKATEKKR